MEYKHFSENGESKMSLSDGLLLTLVSTVICIVFPKLISSVFAVKSKSNTQAVATIPLKQAE